MLQQAILAPFRQTLLPGQFPAVAVYIDIDPAELDVNVHPTKVEVRFLESRKIFHALDEVIDSLIAREGAPAFAAGLRADATSPVPVDRAAGFGQDNAFRWTKPTVSSHGSPREHFSAQPASVPPLRAAEPVPSIQSPLPMEPPEPEARSNPLRSGRLAGTLFNTYLLYELGDELALVDQHAAHERIRYEALRHRVRSLRQADPAAAPATQALLIPEAVRFAPELRQEFEARIPWLEQLGFEAELFGDETALFRGIPPEWGLGELRTRLKNLVDRVLELGLPGSDPASALTLDESLFERLASEACHSAVRAGDRLDPRVAESIVEQLFACEHPWNCPHGRPTVVRVPRARFEEWFLRRV
jgi:DNA mismatch repair protein MutL